MRKVKLAQSALLSIALWLGAAAVCSAQAPGEVRIDFVPGQTKVEFTLSDVLHTIHGSFQLKSGTIHFDRASGAAGGLIVVDAASGDSGNKTRDHKMNKEILETQKYQEATFTPKQVIGRLALPGTSQVQVQGIFRVHGTDHEITLTIPAQVSGSQLQLQTQFEIPFVQWGMKDPSTFVLRVNKEVQMTISGTAKITY